MIKKTVGRLPKAVACRDNLSSVNTGVAFCFTLRTFLSCEIGFFVHGERFKDGVSTQKVVWCISFDV